MHVYGALGGMMAYKGVAGIYTSGHLITGVIVMISFKKMYSLSVA